MKRDLPAHVAGVLLAIALHALFALARAQDERDDAAARAYAGATIPVSESSAHAPTP